jgi:hypothetical protein
VNLVANETQQLEEELLAALRITAHACEQSMPPEATCIVIIAMPSSKHFAMISSTQDAALRTRILESAIAKNQAEPDGEPLRVMQ